MTFDLSAVKIEIPCPGSTKDHPHNLAISDPTTGRLICHYSTKDFICPFMYRDEHKVDTWRSNYNSATGKYDEKF